MTNTVDIYRFRKSEKEKRLFAIKDVFEKNPRLGNFHIWYHGVFAENRLNVEGLEKAINDKFVELGLTEPVRLTDQMDQTGQNESKQ